MSIEKVDARGLSCPEPILLVGEALKENGDSSFVVEVSDTTAKNNIISFLEKKGRRTDLKDSEDGFTITVLGK